VRRAMSGCRLRSSRRRVSGAAGRRLGVRTELLGEKRLEHLAHGIAGQIADDHQLPRALVVGQPVAHEGNHLSRFGLAALVRHHGRGDALAPAFVGQSDHSRLGNIPMFDEDALDALYQASNGVPRDINNICDIALLLGSDAKVKTVGEEQIEKAVYAVNNL